VEEKGFGQAGSITLSVVFGMLLLSSIWGGIYAIHRYYVGKNQNELTTFSKKWKRLEKRFHSNKRYLNTKDS
jgi:hypothetical protein